MSRGLGRRQTLILHALAQLEREDGAGWFYVWSVLEVAWELSLGQEEAAQRAARKAAEVRWLIGLRDRADSGDRQAHDRLRQHVQARMQPSAPPLPVNVRQRRPDGSDLVEGVNPSRCFAKLAQRGLVERNGKRGPGASAGLTEAGRAEVARLQEAGRVSSQVATKPPPSAGATP